MNQDLAQELLEIKQTLDERRNAKARTEGELATYYKRLKQEFGCSNLTEAMEYITELNEEKKQKETLIKKRTLKLTAINSTK